MRVHFVPIRNGPEHFVARAELHFEEGPLSGMCLRGFGLWRSPEGGGLYVTCPSRTTGAGPHHFHYLASADGDRERLRRVKAWIVDEYVRTSGAAGKSLPVSLSGSEAGRRG